MQRSVWKIDNNPIQHRVVDGEQGGTGVAINEYESLSIEELAARIPSVGDPDNLQDIFPLTSTQRGILFQLLLQGTQAPLYVLQIRCDLLGEMNVDLFKQAWQMVTDRHDMLRSVVWHEGLDEPLQIVAKTGALDCTVHDFTGESMSDAKAACDALATESRARLIEVDQQPMMRMQLALLNETESHLVLEWHHILMDGWSVAVISLKL